MYNPGIGLMPLYPNGSNSTFFTQCCQVAICDDQGKCPGCGRLVIGHDAETDEKRNRIRWRSAYKG